MNAQGRLSGGARAGIGAGIVAVIGGGVFGSLAVLASVGVMAASSSRAEAQPRFGDAGIPPYIAAAAQGLVTPPDVEDVEHMCALLTSCKDLPLPPEGTPSSVPGCVTAVMNSLTSPDALKYSLLIRECGLRSNSCTEFKNCAMWGAAPDVCKGRGGSGKPAGRCDDDGRAIKCLNEKVIGVRDCPRGGEQCVVREGQSACILGPCTGENKEGSPPTCSASGFRVLQCDHGKLVSFDCAAFGLKCTVADGKPGCSPPTPACSGTASHCDGNVSVGCLHGHEVRVDCGATGLTCNATPGSTKVGSCVAPPADSDKCDAKDAPKCDGATIKYCFAGRRRSYFCKSLGFNGCVKDGSSVRCGG